MFVLKVVGKDSIEIVSLSNNLQSPSENNCFPLDVFILLIFSDCSYFVDCVCGVIHRVPKGRSCDLSQVDGDRDKDWWTC